MQPQPSSKLEAIAIFENDDLPILIFGLETGCIVDVNAAAIRLFDLPPDYGDLAFSAYLSSGQDQFHDMLREAEKLGYLEFRDDHAPSAAGRRELRLQGCLLRWAGRRYVFVKAHDDGIGEERVCGRGCAARASYRVAKQGTFSRPAEANAGAGAALQINLRGSLL